MYPELIRAESYGRISLRGQTADCRYSRPSSEADSFGRGLVRGVVLWQHGPLGTGSGPLGTDNQRARAGRRPGTGRLWNRQRSLFLCWRLCTLSLVALRMLPSALDSDALELCPVVDVLLCLREWSTLVQHTARMRVRVRVRARGQRSRSAQSQPSAHRPDSGAT